MQRPRAESSDEAVVKLTRQVRNSKKWVGHYSSAKKGVCQGPRDVTGKSFRVVLWRGEVERFGERVLAGFTAFAGGEILSMIRHGRGEETINAYHHYSTLYSALALCFS